MSSLQRIGAKGYASEYARDKWHSSYASKCHETIKKNYRRTIK